MTPIRKPETLLVTELSDEELRKQLQVDTAGLRDLYLFSKRVRAYMLLKDMSSRLGFSRTSGRLRLSCATGVKCACSSQ